MTLPPPWGLGGTAESKECSVKGSGARLGAGEARGSEGTCLTWLHFWESNLLAASWSCPQSGEQGFLKSSRMAGWGGGSWDCPQSSHLPSSLGKPRDSHLAPLSPDSTGAGVCRWLSPLLPATGSLGCQAGHLPLWPQKVFCWHSS